MSTMPCSNTALLNQWEIEEAKRERAQEVLDGMIQTAAEENEKLFFEDFNYLLREMDKDELYDFTLEILVCYRDKDDFLDFGANASDVINAAVSKYAEKMARREA